MKKPVLNPNTIAHVNKDPKSLMKIFDWSILLGKSQELENNLQEAIDVVREAKSLFKKNKLGGMVKHLVWGLTPTFSSKKPGTLDSKVGGIPALSGFHIKGKDSKTIEDVNRSWPCCGICHQKMRFLAQVDLRNWLVPIHCLFAEFEPRYGSENSNSIYAYNSSIGNFRSVEHTSIKKNVFWQFFACPHAGMEYDNPNYNGKICISETYNPINMKDDKVEVPLLERLKFKHPRMPAESFVPTEQGMKIEKLNFRLDLDEEKMDWDIRDKTTDLMERHPELFEFKSDLQLFGAARSQQEPRRYWMPLCTEPTRMTPIISWNDSERDMTYQMYANTLFNDGFRMYGLVDGSCT